MGLESSEWTNNRRMVTVGTEDWDWLEQRLPPFESYKFSSITVGPKSIDIHMTNIQPDQCMNFHFVIAKNPDPEPIELSSWFAVDYPHQKFLDI
jgi:hypothetical protein